MNLDKYPLVTEMQEPPVPGRYYTVPTVKGVFAKQVGTWPVIGVRHNDREYLDFEQMHYHVDGRFVSGRKASAYYHDIGLTTASLPLVSSEPVVLKTMRCSRVQPEYPTAHALRSANFRAFWDAFEGRQCDRNDAGWVCPHRNAGLGSLPVQDGVITCPLHGLRVDASSGRIVAPVVPPSIEALTRRR